jgi:hypothetical protein
MSSEIPKGVWTNLMTQPYWDGGTQGFVAASSRTWAALGANADVRYGS